MSNLEKRTGRRSKNKKVNAILKEWIQSQPMFNPNSTEARGQGKHLALLEQLTNEDFLGQELNNQAEEKSPQKLLWQKNGL